MKNMIWKTLVVYFTAIALAVSANATDVRWMSGNADILDNGNVVHINPSGNLALTVRGAGTLTFKARGSEDGFYYYVDGSPRGYVRADVFGDFAIQIKGDGEHSIVWYTYTYDEHYQYWGEVKSITWNGVEIKYKSSIWNSGGVEVIDKGATLHISRGGFCTLKIEGGGVLTFMARGSSDGFYCNVDGNRYDYFRDSAFEQITISLDWKRSHTIGWYVYDSGFSWGEIRSVMWNGKTLEYPSLYSDLLPRFSHPDGTIFADSLNVSITNSIEGSVIYYTDNGSEPTTNSAVYEEFTITEGTTIKAIASWNGNVSSVAIASYSKSKVATPTLSELDAQEFVGSVRYVTVECITEGASIFYTLDGSTPTKESTPYDGRIKITDTTTIKVRAFKDGFDDSEVATLLVTKKWTIGDTLNAPDQMFDMETSRLCSNEGWIVNKAVSHDGVMSLQSADLPVDGEILLRTVVEGRGVVSFWWKASCEVDIRDRSSCTHGAFSIDGKEYARIDGNETDAVEHETSDWRFVHNETGWHFVRVEITLDGRHEIKWRFVCDDEDLGNDFVWIDEFTWMPSDGTAVTKLNDVAVPYSWLYEHGLLDVHSPEIAVTMKTGKHDGSGRELSVEDDFVAGTNPNDAGSQFKVSIALEDGKPIVKWEPDLNKGGMKNLRKYTTWCCQSLDGTWVDYDSVEDADKDLFRFFKVTVSMP